MSGILREHGDRLLSPAHGVGYCLATSVAFVGSLYILVPRRIRKLDRNHPRQVQWRSGATTLVCLGAFVGREYLLLHHYRRGDPTSGGVPTPAHESSSTSFTATPLVVAQGVIPWICGEISHHVVACVKILAHVVVLYTGPLLQGALMVAVHLKQQSNASISFGEYMQSLYATYVEPTIQSLRFAHGSAPGGWVTWRNLFIAPCLEEVAFRTCMVPILLATDLGPSTVCWTAPLFFGVAHLHHAVQRLREGTKPLVVALQTTFQLAYTTLFGAYASYAYMQTQSTIAIVLVHGFCNWMGLPNFLFFQKEHILRESYRGTLLVAHLVGVTGFGVALARGWLSPSS